MLKRQIIVSLKNIKPYPIISAFLKPFSRRSERSMTSVEESDVGILCYISSLPGFRGILKQRFFPLYIIVFTVYMHLYITSMSGYLEIRDVNEFRVSLVLAFWGICIFCFVCLPLLMDLLWATAKFVVENGY